MFKRASALFAALVVTAASSATAQTAVDLELGLLVDVSGSISNSEFNTQRNGYVAAFGAANSTFWNAFAASGRKLAVTYAYWSDNNDQSQISGGTNGWYLITDAASAQLFATAISNFSRPFDNQTAPGSALNWFLPKITSNNPYIGARKVIDVSGDGCQNDGANTNTASDNAAAAGVTINGLTIGSDNSNCGNKTLPKWYQDNVLTADGFLVSAAGFADFAAAVQTKINLEVSGPQEVVPEPATMTLLATGLAGMAAARRRRRNA